MKIITVANQKGGVGKSSTATALSAILSDRSFKTLLIDCDQQCNSTDTYRARSEGVATIYDVLLDENRIGISEAIQNTECGYIIAGDPLLRQADEKLKGAVDGLYRLSEALESLDEYDYIIIDTAPAMNSILHNCLIAADEEKYAGYFKGMKASEISDTVDKALKMYFEAHAGVDV